MSTFSGSGKSCVKCGVNVADKPRTKDAKGRYYCKPCYEDALQQRSVGNSPSRAGLASKTPLNLMEQLIDAEPAPVPAARCLACGYTMAVGAVLCTNCGYNTQTQHALETKAYRPPKAANSSQAWPMVIGIISLVLGISGVVLHGVSITASLLKQSSASQSHSVGQAIGGFLGFSLSMWLTLAGVGILRRHSSAVDSIKRWAMVKITFYSLCLGGLMILLPLAASGSRRQSTPFDGLGAAELAGILAVLLAWFIAWPIFVLIWFGRTSIQADIQRWRN